MHPTYRYCPQCAHALHLITGDGFAALGFASKYGDGEGDLARLRCAACGFTHWNNPTPVVAGVLEYHGQILLARNAAWAGRMFALITGFLEAGESAQDGMRREIKEETNLDVQSLNLIGVYDFFRQNQVIIAYHAVVEGTVKLSPELSEYKLFDLHQACCWPSGTGFALADFLRGKGHTPQFIDLPQVSPHAVDSQTQEDA